MNKLYKGSQKIQQGLDALTNGLGAYNEKFARRKADHPKSPKAARR
ncbi:hypothetical protein [Bacillus sp. H15-1]|nr:hypothetical protein [Bacillus sp. H15-1]